MATGQGIEPAGPHRAMPAGVWAGAMVAALLVLAASPRRVAAPSRPPRPADDAAGTPPVKEGPAAEALAAREPHRGRGADTPSDIPAAGWRDIALRVYAEFFADRILLVAAGVTFYAILALFPAVAALVSIYGLVADPGSINTHIGELRGVLPDGALDILGEQVKRLAAKGDGTLGLSAAFGILLSLWSANGGMKAIFDALNIAYEEEEKRNLLWLNVRSLAFTFGALVFVILALLGIVVVPVALAFLGLDAKAWYIALLRWPVMLLLVLGALTVLYRYGPSRSPARWRWITWGSAVAGTLWLAVSALFSWYVANFGSYNETYGSLGAAIGLMTWIWISTTVILVGAELNAEMERQTAVDTTTGRPRPLGQRKARVADTVAVSAG